MVAGGMHSSGDTNTAETLLKDGGTAWQFIANLPYSTRGCSGVGINGLFYAIGKAFLMTLFLFH